LARAAAATSSGNAAMGSSWSARASIDGTNQSLAAVRAAKRS
jgi:hypothetical protein